MLSASLALAVGQVTLSTSYIPDLNLTVTHQGIIEPCLTDKYIEAYSRDKMGFNRHYRWQLDQGTHTFNLVQYAYDGAKPKLTPRELSEMFYFETLKMAEAVDAVSGKPEMMDRHKQKFVDRKVESFKLGPFEAWRDSHRDKLTGSFRNQIAWGNDQYQIQLEVNGKDSEPSRKFMDDAIRSLKFGKLTPTQVKALPLKMQSIGDMGLAYLSPAVLSLYERPAMNKKRPEGIGVVASANVCDGLEITAMTDSYKDAVVEDTTKTANSFKVSADMAGIEPISAQITPFAGGGFKGHVVRQRYKQFGQAYYGASLVAAAPGKTMILHFFVSEAMGGKTLAEKMLGSLALKR